MYGCKKYYFIIVLQFTRVLSYGQNLVPNPSFEDTIRCPNFPGQVSACRGWYGYGNSPDYFNACEPTNYIGVPFNAAGYQNALSGKAYCGFIAYFYMSPDTREMLGRQLMTSLIKGNKYYVSFNVSLAEYAKYTCNNLGISFSTVSRANDIMSFVNKNRPFVYTKSIIKDYTNWVKISGSFIADSNYQYIIIGNFLADSLTNYEISNSPEANGNNAFNDAYYYIDDVCVSTDSLTCVNKTGLIATKKEKNIVVYPNPFINDITIQVTENSNKEVVIFDLLSKEMIRQAFNGNITLDLQYLSKGIYYYEIRNSNGMMERGKMVKE